MGIKPIEEFYKNKDGKDELHSLCKECMREKKKKYYKNNIEKIRKVSREYYKNNIGCFKEYYKNNSERIKNSHKIYKKNNPSKVKEINRKSYAIYYLIPKNKLSSNIAGGIRYSINGNKGGKHWEDTVGYTLTDLIKHLEKQFKKGMSWQNKSKWQLDHIIPINLWEFNSYNDREFKQCWALCNLQPLWANENLKKGTKCISQKI